VKRVLAGFAALLVLGAAAGPARAATSAGLAEVAGARFPERVYALSLPREQTLAPGQIEVRENGRVVSDVAVTPAHGASAYRFGVVLAIDASPSMRGRPLRGAIAAARAFVAHRVAGQPVAIVTFAADVRVVQPFTTDAAAIDRALSSLTVRHGGTRLLDGIGQSIGMMEPANIGSGSVIVLSDGSAGRSSSDLARVTGAARAANVRVFGVGLTSSNGDFGVLNLLAAATHAEFSRADSLRDLARVYDRLGSQLSQQYLLRYRTAAAPGRTVRVEVRVAGLEGVAAATYVAPVPAHPRPAPFRRRPGDALMLSPMAALAACLMAGALFALALWLVLRPRRQSLRVRMASYVGAPAPEREPRRAAPLSARMRQGAERSLENAAWGARFREKLDVAGIEVPPEQLLVWIGLGTAALFVLLPLLAGTPIAALAAFGVPVGAHLVIENRIARQRRLFAEQLPDTLLMIASAMRAGHSFGAALAVVVTDAAEPTHTELQRVIADEQLGVPLDDALDVVVRRMESEDFQQVALVATLQRETGGNTAEVLERVTDAVRQRLNLRRLVNTLTAQGRMSRWVLTALPLVLLGFITVANPDYTRPLFATPVGHLLLGMAAVMVFAGSMVIKRIVTIKV
jgi:tight adherence protein B